MTARELIESLIGARVELQDDIAIEQYWFGREGYVAVTLGQKNGPVCAPLFSYRITSDDVLEIEGRHWEKLQLNGDELTVLCDGMPKTFKVTRE